MLDAVWRSAGRRKVREMIRKKRVRIGMMVVCIIDICFDNGNVVWSEFYVADKE